MYLTVRVENFLTDCDCTESRRGSVCTHHGDQLTKEKVLRHRHASYENAGEVVDTAVLRMILRSATVADL